MIKALLSYQQVDAKLFKIEKELASSEDRKKAYSAKKYLEQTMPESVNKLDNRAQELSSAYDKTLSDLAKVKDQQTELMNALSTVEDENAGAYLMKKADELISKIKALSDMAKKISQEIQDVMKEYANIRKTTKSAQDQYAVNGAKYNELKASKKDEMDAIKKELAILEKDVDKALLERYKQKRADKIFPVFFEVKDKVCGACNMELSMAALSDLKGGKVIECDNCRRLLYKS